jgi:hypothetical protein
VHFHRNAHRNATGVQRGSLYNAYDDKERLQMMQELQIGGDFMDNLLKAHI